jgi:hydrogenase expression/formation protein HypD
MHVCGTQEITISRFGLRNLLPEGVRVIAGPGCPVCITSVADIDTAIKLASMDNVILTTFGDMLRVPGSSISLEQARASGADVRVVFGINEALALAKAEPSREVVHFAIGFETTAPSTAATVMQAAENNVQNFSILCAHRLIPPAMVALLEDSTINIDAFLCPGHASTVSGPEPYEPIVKRYRKPCVIAGFEPLDILAALVLALEQLLKGESSVQVEYTRSVKQRGNMLAQQMMGDVFEECNGDWRGLGVINGSALELRKEFACFDVLNKLNVTRATPTNEFHTACRCADILKGKAEPHECPLFNKVCTPQRPVGPCMVSIEGSCNIALKYGGIYAR